MLDKPLILTASPNPSAPPPGIYRDISWEEYASWNCFSKSMVPHALKSGLHLDHYIHSDRKTKPMVLGSLVDTMVLEPEMFDERYVYQPTTYTTEVTRGRGAAKATDLIEKPWNLNSKTCKAIVEKARESGRELISGADYSKAEAIHAALMANAEASVAITEGEKQVSFVWVDEDTGVRCKGRADLVGANTIDDLKTTIDASPEGFRRAIGKFLYYVQGAAYTNAWLQLTGDQKEFRFICAETGDVPAVALYELDSVSLVAGSLMFRRALMNVARWLEHGVEGYSPYWEPIEAPKWLVDYEINVADVEVSI